MCNPMSGVVTRNSVLWDEWVDSHRQILEKAGIKDNEMYPDFVKFEITPPDDDYTLPLDQWVYKEDQLESFPEWYNRENAERAARAVLPLWAKTHLVTAEGAYLDLAERGAVSLLVLAQGVTIKNQRGGMVQFYANSAGTVKNQRGGTVWFLGNSTGTIENQQGGEVQFLENSTRK